LLRGFMAACSDYVGAPISPGATIPHYAAICMARIGSANRHPMTEATPGKAAILRDQLDRSKKVGPWLRSNGHGLSFERTRRVVMAAASFQLTFDHHDAVVMLTSRHPASALALIRPLYESYIMGLWLFRIANDQQIEAILARQFVPGLDRMVRDLDRGGLFDRPMLPDMKPVMKKMDGLTHGGVEHIQHRYAEGKISPMYPDELMVDALRIADLFTVMAILESAALAENIPLGDRLNQEGRDLLGLPAP